MLTIIYDALNCSDYELALSIINTLSRDQGTLSKLKEDHVTKKNSPKLKEDITMIKADKIRLLRCNDNLKSNFQTKENDIK